MSSNNGPVRAVLGTAELLQLIVACSVWQALRGWSQTSKGIRQVVQEESHRRVKHVIKPFIDTAQLDSFFSLLRKCKGVVAGSIARRFFALEQPWYQARRGRINEMDESRDMNLIAPYFTMPALEGGLVDLGYEAFEDEEIHLPLRSAVTSIRRGWRTLDDGVSNRHHPTGQNSSSK
jgi:hypothetical protein